MAFVFEAERFKKEVQKNDQFYLEHKKYIIRKSKIPFNTTQKRSKKIDKNKKTKQEILFENFHRLLDKKKQLIYEHLKKIKQPKQTQQSNNFKIRKSQSLQTHHFYKKLSPKRKQQIYKPPKIPVKILNNPTIPNEGNLEMKQMKIIPNEEKLVKKQQQFKIPTNPFYYGHEDEYPQVDFLKEQNLFNSTKNIISWKKQLNKTKSLQPKKLYSDQDFYTYKEQQPMYKLKPSSFFKSKVPRTQLYFNNIASQNYKKKKNMSQDIFLKENVPGPGYYLKTDEQQKKQKNQEFQNFDSSVPRFQIVNQQYQVDPGLYNHKGQFEQIKNYNSRYGNLSFSTFAKKFLNLKEKDQLDVPYKIQHGDFNKKTYNSKKYFINKDDRFIYQKKPTLHTQKAKLYEEQQVQKHIEYLEAQERIIIPLNKKTVPFNVGDQKLKKCNSEYQPFTAYYDVSNNNIKDKLEKLLEDQNKKENFKDIYFESKQNRWKYQNKIKDEKKKVDKKDNRVFKDLPQYYYVPEVLKPTKIPFQSTEKRFKQNNKENQDNDIRGIARPEWETKSFNIKFQLFKFKFYQ